jgi:predicted nucleotidyltransferase
MKKVEKIMKNLKENMPTLREKYKVKTLGVFGSYVRGEQKKSSDLDILVEFQEPVGLFKFMELEEFLEKNTGVKIDLVSKKALKPRIRKHILEEVISI